MSKALKQNEDKIILAFQEIEKITNRTLPKSAYEHSESWWSNNYDHSQAIAWIDAGYHTEFVTETYEKEKIGFIKIK